MLCARGLLKRLVLLLLLAAAFASAGEPSKGKAKPSAPAKEPPAKPSTYRLKRGPFKIQVKLKGLFEAEKMTEVVLRPEAWSQLTVLKAAEPGTRVKKGDVVVALDTRKIDEAIREAEAGRTLSDVALQLAQEEVAALDKSLPIDLAAAERAKKIADEDLKRYQEIDRPLSVKQARFSVKSAENYLAYQKEELRQLEKMYKADDLTEETEEIILKRQRDLVERMTFALEVAKSKADRTLNVELPRRDVTVKEGARRQAIALKKAKATLPMTLKKARLELAKQKRAQKKANEKLQKLKSDRQAMTVKSPVDGLVYYGPCVRGNWPKLAQSLGRGATLSPNQVVMTIVEPRPMFVRAAVPEKQLQHLRPGITGHAIPVGYPDLKLQAKVETISAIPVSAGQFGAEISIGVGKDAAHLMPGMSCDVKLVAYRKADALTVPASAIFADELDETKTAVYVREKDGSHEKRLVTVGKKTGKKAEILDGLKEGDVVFLEKPKKAK